MSAAILVGVGCGILAAGATWLVLGALGKINLGVSREVIVGIVSGILTSILMWMVAGVFSTLILPWYQEHTYKGLDISGRWRITLGDGGVVSSHLLLTADLKQITERVTGVVVVGFKDNPDKRPLTYTLDGFRRDQFLALTIEKVNRKQLGIGTSLTEIVDVGNKLEGFMCIYDAGTRKLRCDSSKWTKVEEDE